MTVTIIGKNEVMGTSEKYEGIDWDFVTLKEVNKRNGYKVVQIRIARGKRDIVVSNGCYNEITIQDEETGRYLLKYNK